MTLQPIGDNLVIKIKDKEKEEVTKTGLILLNQGTQQSLRQDRRRKIIKQWRSASVFS